jgi:hypothetical protein
MNQIIKPEIELIFMEDSSLWISFEKQEYLISIENINFEKFIRKGIGIIFPILFIVLVNTLKAEGVDEFPFKVYKDSKEIKNFFVPSTPVENFGRLSPPSTLKTFPAILILLSLFQQYETSQQRKLLERSLEIDKLRIIENRKLLNTLLISGGKIAVAICLSSSLISLLILLRLAKSPEFKEKFKEFESKQFFIVLFQLMILASWILLNDIKKIPTTLSQLKLNEKINLLLVENFELFFLSILLIGGFITLVEYEILPILFKCYPELEPILDRYNIRLSDREALANLLKLQKRISILETIKIKDKAMIKVASTEALLERTYQKKLFAGMKNEMLRLMNELPPIKARDPNFKPSYFYKMHQSYRIKQNVLAILYFLIYMRILRLEENFPFMTNLSLNRTKDESNGSNNSL